MTFGSVAALRAYLIAAAVGAVGEVEGKVHGTMRGNLGQFYGEFSPEMYIRTDALNSSLQSTGVMSTGSGASAEIFFTTPSYSTGTWSGETVLNVALEGGAPHGGYAGGTPVWTASMAELGDIEGLLIGALASRL